MAALINVTTIPQTNAVTHLRCWKDISFSGKRLAECSGIINYIETRKNIPGFPFVIFTDHVPAEDELLNLLTADLLFSVEKRPFIIALHAVEITDQLSCWQLLNLGITDIIEWEQEEELIDFLESLYKRNKDICDILESPLVSENLVGESSAWKKFLSGVIEATLFSQASILLVGPSGTGKELISRLVHTLDKRTDKKKLIIVDCTTISPELSGSELFGHERGSYTSAVQAREGAVALANGGTLFLDEVGELPLNMQAELLRVLQEGTYKKVGSNNWQKTNFRLVCATNKELQEAVKQGTFRQDLYFRIADCEFAVPSLQERKEDIPLLVNYFLCKLFTGNECPKIDKLVMDYLLQRLYPGNVRELKQLVQRMALKHVKHKKITIGEVPVNDRALLCYSEKQSNGRDNMKTIIRNALLTGENWWDLKDRISETAIQVALDMEGHNKQKAAERLGVDVRTVQQYVKKKG
jgi:transcriptional regulator with GAF, ATPase, and Fis domain